MVIITVCNHKGGTGKTTSVVNLAAALGLSGHRTLVIDLDPQAFLTHMMGVRDPSNEASSLTLFSPEADLAAVEKLKMEGFDLLPATSSLSKAMRKYNRPTDVFWLQEAFKKRADYDIVLIDTAAAVTVYSLNALVACQHVLIPVTPEYQPVLGAEQTYQTVMMVKNRLNPRLQSPTFMFTQVDGRRRSHHLYQGYLRQRYGERVMDGVVRTSASLARTRANGTTVFQNEPQARGARDYANAADELLRRVEGADAWIFMDKLGS